MKISILPFTKSIDQYGFKVLPNCRIWFHVSIFDRPDCVFGHVLVVVCSVVCRLEMGLQNFRILLIERCFHYGLIVLLWLQ